MQGSCLCGAVTYEIAGELRPSVACHCTQCRKTSGHYWSATQVGADALRIHDPSQQLRWFQSSDKARRGFCGTCGSSLFWQHQDDGGAMSIGSGTLDAAPDLTTAKHIFTAEKGAYYDIKDGLPQS